MTRADDASAARIANEILELARLQLDGQLSSGDNLDSKAFGVLAVDIAAAALAVAIRDGLHGLLWLPFALFFASAIVSILTVVARPFDSGPRVEDFYNMYSDSTERMAAVAMLSELVPSLTGNDRILTYKGRTFSIGLYAMTASLIIVAGLFAKPEVKIGCQTVTDSQTHIQSTVSPLPSPLPSPPPTPGHPSPLNHQRCLIEF